AIERSRGAYSRTIHLCTRVGTWQPTKVQGLYSDAPYYLHCDCHAGCGRVIPFSAGFQDGSVHHCIGGDDCACRAQPPQWQALVDAALPRSSRCICSLSSDAVLAFSYLHPRYGDTGALCRFAHTLWKICWYVGAQSPYSESVIAPHSLLKTQELRMSRRNGDKSRFNRQRKQNIARRKRSQELLELAAKAPKPGKISSRVQPHP